MNQTPPVCWLFIHDVTLWRTGRGLAPMCEHIIKPGMYRHTEEC